MDYETVARVADDLKRKDPNGKNPGVRKVHTIVRGDYVAVTEHMKTWRAQQPAGPASAPPDLSPGLVKAMRDEISLHRGAATIEKTRELEEIREELEDLSRELVLTTAARREADHQLEQMRGERERLLSTEVNQGQHIERLQEQIKGEQAAKQAALVEVARIQLKSSGDAEHVATMRSDLEVRRQEIETERAGRIQAERDLAASRAALEAQKVHYADLLSRVAAADTERSVAQASLDAERALRYAAERERDIALERASAAVARAEDLQGREAQLRARLDGSFGNGRALNRRRSTET